MKWNNIRHKEWWKNFLTGVLATAIGVGLTFEVNNRVEHHKQKQAQFQTAMIAVYDIDEIVRHFLEDKKREDAFFKVAMYLYTHQDELETVAMDSLWMAASYLVYDPTEIPEWTDDSSEKVFTSSMEVLQDLGDVVFYDNVQECYLSRRNLLRKMEQSVTFRRPIPQDFVLEYRKHVPAENMDYNGMMNKPAMAGLVRQMFHRYDVPLYLQKYLMRDREYCSFLDNLIRLNRENKYIMNITDEAMASYVEKHINKTMPAKPKLLAGQWEQRQNNQHNTYIFRPDRTVSLTKQMDYRIGIYVEGEDVNVYMLAPLTFTIDGRWNLKGDSLQLDLCPETTKILSFDLDWNYLPKTALERSKDSLDIRKQQYLATIEHQIRETTRWNWTNKVSLAQSGTIMFWENEYTMPWGQTVTDRSQLLKRGK